MAATNDVDVDQVFKAIAMEAEKKKREKAAAEERRDPPGEADNEQRTTDEGLSPEISSTLLDGIGPEDLELTADTFNPSSLFDDKSQAEWFGNIIANAAKDAFKGIISQAGKLPRWIWLLVFAAGALVGLIGAAWLMGGLGGSGAAATGHATSTATATLPPPPTFTSTGITIYGAIRHLKRRRGGRKR